MSPQMRSKVSRAILVYEDPGNELTIRAIAARFGIGATTLTSAIAAKRTAQHPEDEVTC